ncbi:mitochondrial 50S ribosomal protein [Favolaschia claudopus]|uniref:Large ribosomal subunit protein bL28m n=1 Tax=Favolaschia claudopus TaxID=2862362 RepID=A0AAW0CA07_9AGAR
MRPTVAALAARAPSQAVVTPQPFKRSQFGLFHGKTKLYGNSVPFSLKKTRRTWLPNVQRKRVFSETLQSRVRVKMTTTALRTIKKKGGIDNYLMETSADLLGWKGMQLRITVRDAQKKNAAAEAAEAAKTAVKPRRVKKSILPPEPESALKALENPRTADDFVRRMRRLAARGTGQPFASAEETMEYMKQQKMKQDRAVSRRTSIKLPI